MSIASVAVGDFGKSIFSRFDNKTVLVIGAGEMAEETLTYLQSEARAKLWLPIAIETALNVWQPNFRVKPWITHP